MTYFAPPPPPLPRVPFQPEPGRFPFYEIQMALGNTHGLGFFQLSLKLILRVWIGALFPYFVLPPKPRAVWQ